MSSKVTLFRGSALIHQCIYPGLPILAYTGLAFLHDQQGLPAFLYRCHFVGSRKLFLQNVHCCHFLNVQPLCHLSIRRSIFICWVLWFPTNLPNFVRDWCPHSFVHVIAFNVGCNFPVLCYNDGNSTSKGMAASGVFPNQLTCLGSL